MIDPDNIHPLKNKCDVARLMLKAFKLFVLSYRNHELSEFTIKQHNKTMAVAIEFINKRGELNNNAIKEMEAWELASGNVKPQSTRCRRVKSQLKSVVLSSLFSPAEKKRLELIIHSFKPAKNADTESYTLTSWFCENSPWLRQEMGDQYNLLESPKRLAKSFQVTIATMLLFVLDARRELIENKQLHSIYIDMNDPKHGEWTQQKLILSFLALLYATTEDKVSALRSFSVLECGASRIDILFELLAKCQEGKESENYDTLYENFLFRKTGGRPLIPLSHFIKNTSKTEEALLAYICATLAIQKTDIYKLTTRHIALKKNKNGIVRQLEIDYYKGRADRRYKPPTFSGASVVARAILAYLNNLPKNQDKLFTLNALMGKTIFSNPFARRSFTVNNFQSVFARIIMQSDTFNIRLEKEHKREGTGKLFSDAISHMYQEDIDDFQSYRTHLRNRSLTTQKYYENVGRHVPITFPSLSAVKNSSIHARSDKYRAGDLVNQNSHTSLTEKLSYVTDSNKSG